MTTRRPDPDKVTPTPKIEDRSSPTRRRTSHSGSASGGRWDRPELHRMLDQLREGDTVVVWKLDRLSRLPVKPRRRRLQWSRSRPIGRPSRASSPRSLGAWRRDAP